MKDCVEVRHLSGWKGLCISLGLRRPLGGSERGLQGLCSHEVVLVDFACLSLGQTKREKKVMCEAHIMLITDCH